MQIRVSKLRDKLSLLQPLVPRKPALEILSSVLVKDRQLTATDLEARVSLNLDEANGSTMLLPYHSATDFLKYIPGDEVVTIESKDKKVSFSWENGNASFETKDAADYPDLNLKELSSVGMIDGDQLIEALAAAAKYCSTDEAKPVLSGVTLYLGNVLQIAASDGFRMSFQSINLSYQNPIAKTIVIPAKAIAILDELWKKEPAQVGLSDNLINQITAKRQLELSLYAEKEALSTMVIKFGKVTFACRMIFGKPPDHLALLNNFKEPNKAVFLGPDLYNAVRRVSGVARDGTGIVRMVWDESKMTVSSANSEGSKVSAQIPIQSGSIAGRIAINVGYLMDYLADKSGMVVMGKSENPTAPVLLHYGNRPIVAVMPMAVKWEDEQPAAEKPEAKAQVPANEKPKEKEAVGVGVAKTSNKPPVKTKEKPKRNASKKK